MPDTVDPNSLIHPPQSLPDRLLHTARKLMASDSARKGPFAAVDQGVISAANFIASIYLARVVTPSELGVYAVGFLAIYFIRAIQDGLIIQPLNSMGAVMESAAWRRYFSATALLQLLLSAASAAAAAGLGWALAVTGNDVAGPTIYALWFSFLAWQLQEFIRRAFYTRGEVGKAVAVTIIANAVRMVSLVLYLNNGVHTGKAGLDAIAWGSLTGFLVGCVWARPYWSLAVDPLFDTMRSNWKFGRWVMGGSLANWVAVQLYPILTAGMVSFTAAGAYQALQNLVAPVHVILRATDTFTTPRAAKAFHQSGYSKLHRILRITYLVAGLPILTILTLAVFFSKDLLHLLRGDTYQPYAAGAIPMALFYLLWFAYWPLQTAFKAIRNSRPIFIANLLAIGTMFTVGLWLIQRWGVYGTLAGQALNALIVSIVLWTAWLRQTRKDRQASQAQPAAPAELSQTNG